jgi:ABC-type sugar transport system ATPase subunit
MFPVVAIIGSRQCGKSTLVKNIRPDWKYCANSGPIFLKIFPVGAAWSLESLAKKRNSPCESRQKKLHLDQQNVSGGTKGKVYMWYFLVLQFLV